MFVNGFLNTPFPAPTLESSQRLVIRRIDADNACAARHPFLEIFLPDFLLEGAVGDILRQFGRNHNHALAVAHHHIPRRHRHAGATDRNLHIDRMMGYKRGRGVGRPDVGRQFEAAKSRCIPQRAVGDKAGRAALADARP